MLPRERLVLDDDNELRSRYNCAIEGRVCVRKKEGECEDLK